MLDYIKSRRNRNDVLMLAIIEKKQQPAYRHISLSRFAGFTGQQIQHADRGKGLSGKGYAYQAMELILTHAFEVLNLRKISLGVVADNMPAFKLYEKIGFKVEGIRKQQGFYAGKYCDDYIMGLFAEDFFNRLTISRRDK
jgi:RimJ/RimL family protein N-acetyltransferase